MAQARGLGKAGHPGSWWGMTGPVTRTIARVAPLVFVATTALLVAPLYPWLGDSIEPRVGGLPWSLVYVLLVIVVNAAALTGLYLGRVIDAGEDEAAGEDEVGRHG